MKIIFKKTLLFYCNDILKDKKIPLNKEGHNLKSARVLHMLLISGQLKRFGIRLSHLEDDLITEWSYNSKIPCLILYLKYFQSLQPFP